MNNSVCFTGHRPEKIISPYNENSTIMKYIKAKLSEEISKAINDGCTVFYTGMAKGIDLIAAELVLKQKESNSKLRLISVIPYHGQNSSFDAGWKSRYDNVLIFADEVIVLSEHYYNGCLLFRNRYMVNNTSRVIAVFNGENSGTSYTINYAKKCNRQVCLISI